MLRKLLVAAFSLWASCAEAQWQVPNHALPTGKGAGVTGFNSVAPGTAGNCLASDGTDWKSRNCGIPGVVTLYPTLTQSENPAVPWICTGPFSEVVPIASTTSQGTNECRAYADSIGRPFYVIGTGTDSKTPSLINWQPNAGNPPVTIGYGAVPFQNVADYHFINVNINCNFVAAVDCLQITNIGIGGVYLSGQIVAASTGGGAAISFKPTGGNGIGTGIFKSQVAVSTGGGPVIKIDTTGGPIVDSDFDFGEINGSTIAGSQCFLVTGQVYSFTANNLRLGVVRDCKSGGIINGTSTTNQANLSGNHWYVGAVQVNASNGINTYGRNDYWNFAINDGGVAGITSGITFQSGANSNTYVTRLISIASGTKVVDNGTNNTCIGVECSNGMSYNRKPVITSANWPGALNSIPVSDGTSVTSFISVSAVLDLITSTRGAILYRGSSGWAGRGPSTSGYPLLSAGAGADPDYGQLPLASIVALSGNTILCNPTGGSATPTTCGISGLQFSGGGALQSLGLTGDVTSAAGSAATTLATVNTNVGTFGSATQVAQVTLNAKGLVTAAANVTISGVAPGGAAGGDLTGTYPNPTLAAIISAGGPTGSATVTPVITYDAKGRLTTVTTATIAPPFSAVTGTISVAQVGGSGASHAVPVDVAGTITWKVVPDCTDTSGNHLNYTQSTDAWSCGTTVGAAAAGTLTGATLAAGVTASSLTSFGTNPLLETPTLSRSSSTSGTNTIFKSFIDATGKYAENQYTVTANLLFNSMRMWIETTTTGCTTACGSTELRSTIDNGGTMTTTAWFSPIGTQIGSAPTGGFKGAGTLNVKAGIWAAGLTTTTASQTAALCQASTGEIVADTSAVNLCVASSLRFKKNIADLGEESGIAEVMKFRPVSFEYKPEGIFKNERRYVGLIAEEVNQIDKRLVGYDKEGQPHSVQYEFLTAIIVKAMQELNQRVNILEGRVK